jgi:hypothetical protein
MGCKSSFENPIFWVSQPWNEESLNDEGLLDTLISV